MYAELRDDLALWAMREFTDRGRRHLGYFSFR